MQSARIVLKKKPRDYREAIDLGWQKLNAFYITESDLNVEFMLMSVQVGKYNLTYSKMTT